MLVKAEFLVDCPFEAWLESIMDERDWRDWRDLFSVKTMTEMSRIWTGKEVAVNSW